MGKPFTKLFTYQIGLILLFLLNGFYGAANANIVPKASKYGKARFVGAVDQTITFNQFAPKFYADADFDPGATASSGLPVEYVSNNTAVARIVANKIQIVGTGTALITASQEGNATYNRATRVTRTLTVNKSNLTVTASSQTRNYGVNNAAITLSFVGFKAGESINQLPGKPRAVTTVTNRTSVGTYEVSVTSGTSNNYTFTYVPGSITINKVALSIAAVAKTKAYGAAIPALTLAYTGFTAGDNASKLTTQPKITTTATANSPAGSYPITVSGATSPNYNITQVNSTLTVAKGNLTVTAAAKNRVYGMANPALTYTIKGFVLGQTNAVLLTPVVAATTAVQNSPAGVYPITLSGATAANYNITYVQGSLTVNKAPLTISSVAKTKAYGQANPEFTVGYAGFVNGENESVLTAKPTLSTTATQNSPIGAYDINVSGAAASNYNITYRIGKLTIIKATLTITANSQTRQYGNPNPVFTATYTGFINGDTEANLTTKPTIATTAVTGTRAGSYAITVNGAVSANYNLVYRNGTLTITKAALIVKADDVTRVYGSATPGFTITYTGFVNGETVDILSKKATIIAPVTAKSPAGNYTITASGASSLNYDVTYESGTLTITKKALTITAQNKLRAYGIPNPALTVVYTGLVNGDKAPGILSGAPVLSTTATTNSNLGSYPIEVSGNVTAANYTIEFENGTLSVGKATIRVIVVNKAKTYGQPNPAFTFAYTGFVNGDNASVITTLPQTPATTATTASSPGSYPITTAGGAVAENYDIVYVQGKLTISKAVLNVVLDNKTKVYGEPNPIFTYTLNGFVNGDTPQSEPFIVEPKISTAAETAGAGVYNIQVADGYTNKYILRSVPAKLTVTKANLLISAVDASRGHASPNPVFTATYTGLVNGDTEASITTKPTFTTNATATSVPGVYELKVSGAASPNYNITYAGAKFTITKGKLFVKAVNVEKTYGDANPAFKFTYDGFASGDTEASLTSPPTIRANVNTATPVGTYTITPLGGVDDEYELVYVNGTLTINKANVTVSAQNASRIYGAVNPVLNATYTGFVNGETEAVLSKRATGITTATITSGVGNYGITFTGATAANYQFIYKAGTLSITPAALTITANNASRVYGITNPGFTSSYKGFVNSDTQASLTTAPQYTTTANQTSGVGTYPITVGNAASANYIISYTPALLTITKAPLLAKAEDKSKTYGTANPAFTLTYSGFVNGDTEAVLTSPATVSSAATVSSGAGNYAIIPTGGSAANYNLAYTNGTLTVNKALLTVTANNAIRLFNTANPNFTVGYTGFINGDTETSLTTRPVVTTPATATSPNGSYALIPGGAASANYSFNYVNGVLTITPSAAAISFTLLPAKSFGDTDFDPTVTNNVNEPMVYTSSNTAVATIINGKIHIVGAGTATITAAFATNSNYSQTLPVSQLFVVDKARQTISFATIPAITRGSSYNLNTVIASSGLPVTLSVENATIASLQGTNLRGAQIGNTTVTADQSGNSNYYPASSVVQNVIVSSGDGNVDVIVHQAVSPNGDGINDTFLIEGIASYPDNEVTLINRNGVKVYQVTGYDNVNRVFNGRSNVTNSLLMQGTYFYQIKYVANGQGRKLTGYFVLKY